ncbi:WD40 repeat-like protein [Suillus paluster]|uniref:WD40 repeat-like protein n=1 Tax=Suillus paluster TaxID=48578 RepID=UPI001B863201|nr:WD40 repeat-like protein [Suillus paluster]KAG1754079.1 WD40 repeat-like protein [Suillus paluster]
MDDADGLDDLHIRLPSSLRTPSTLKYAPAHRTQRARLARALSGRLDRVGVLGGDDWGHTGCVNAVSWAQDGELLISSGDDTKIRVWRMDSSGSARPDAPSSGSISLTSEAEKSSNAASWEEYPFACQSVISTGHTQNVFNAQMLPFSTRIATVSGDRQVRVFDVGEAVGQSLTGSEMHYTTRESCFRVLRCHTGRTKRIITEDSPDLFLTVAEAAMNFTWDGQVRQHDLRTSHSCTSGACPAPLVTLPHELSTIALSPLTPYQFVVGGESPYAHLFDRRHAGRYLRAEWGVPPDADSATTCVRRFGRRSRAKGERKGYEHVTGARMSAWNGHEVLLSYNSDGVFLYSTRDEPEILQDKRPHSILTPNPKRRRLGTTKSPSSRSEPLTGPDVDMIVEDRLESFLADDAYAMDDADDESQDDEEDDEEDDDEDEEDAAEDDRMFTPEDADAHQAVPVVYPRMRFTGHCNVETVKDVNFLGPHDEFVTSGSDDGNFFVWRKSTGELVDILEGDQHVVNVIESHPHLPLIAVSGIDTTVKVRIPNTFSYALFHFSQLFAPARGVPSFSRWNEAETIKKNNARAARTGLSGSAELQFAHLILNYEQALRGIRGDEEDDSEVQLTQCMNQ